MEGPVQVEHVTGLTRECHPGDALAHETLAHLLKIWKCQIVVFVFTKMKLWLFFILILFYGSGNKKLRERSTKEVLG